MDSYPLVTVPEVLTGYMLQDSQNNIQVKIIQSRLILYFLFFLALIIHELGLRDKGNWEST